MKSVRLNKEIRTAIVTNILKTWDKSHPAPVGVAAPSRDGLVNALYNEWYEANKIDTLIACGMKDDYLNKDSYVYVEVKDAETGRNIQEWGHCFHDERGTKESRVFKRNGGMSCDNTHPAFIEWQAKQSLQTESQGKIDKRNKARKDYGADIRAVLDSVNTTKQLVEAWPEIEQYIPNTFRDPSSFQLPSILPTLPTGE